ncbi:hypothetical protein, partial [Yersinia enterocolitica]|uniref:hypothetical protein n=1 Tax=Yersinia enterocolitica TaxID=630 RepID=UPI0020C21F6B
GKEVNHDKADTVKRAVGVLDRNGAIRSVAASGTRILFPNIHGLGTLRQRWPISPLHQEGNSVYKELDALKEIVNHMPAYSSFFQEAPNTNAN